MPQMADSAGQRRDVGARRVVAPREFICSEILNNCAVGIWLHRIPIVLFDEMHAARERP
jgi:hypothetical protein